jgi:hypothetical protein
MLNFIHDFNKRIISFDDKRGLIFIQLKNKFSSHYDETDDFKVWQPNETS